MRGQAALYRPVIFGHAPAAPWAQVMIPGYGGTMAEWTPQLLRLLANGREVIIFDVFAQGLSRVRAGGYVQRHCCWQLS